MEYRNFGATGLRVSEVGFGAWAIGGSANVGGNQIGWGPVDDQVSIRAIHAALDAGINFFDTADFYGLGHSEKIIGQTIGHNREVLIATKVGQRAGDNGSLEVNYSKDYIIKACEASLCRLRREVIDYYQLHVAKLHHLEQGECIEAMGLLQQQGKIRFWGQSLFTFAPEVEANYLMNIGQGNGFQMVLNLINQMALPVMQQAYARGYGIIARMPLQFGLLSGKFRPADRFHHDDHRSKRLTESIIRDTLDILRTEMVPMAKQYHTTLAGLALSFVLGFKEVGTVIPGIRTPEQVAMNTGRLVKLSSGDHAHLASLYQSRWQPVLEMIKLQG